VHDTALVRALDGFGNLARNHENLVDWKLSSSYAVCQTLAVCKLHHQEAHVVDMVHRVHGGDVGVIERREYFGFAVEARRTVGIIDENVGENLDGNLAVERGVDGAPHHTHAAFADLVDKPVVKKQCAGLELQRAGYFQPCRRRNDVMCAV